MLEKKSTILVVDDDMVMLSHLHAILSGKYVVKTEHDGVKALEYLKKGGRPDLILMDVDMPGMSGYSVMEKIKEIPECKYIPGIFLTALQGSEDEVKGIRLGAVDYVRKPFDMDVLLSRIERHIENKRLNEEADSELELIDRNKLKKLIAPLSEQEQKVATYIIRGFQNSEIAREMNISEGYVRNIAHRVYTKLDIAKRSELRERAIKKEP